MMTSLKTPEELYEAYKSLCGTCGHTPHKHYRNSWTVAGNQYRCTEINCRCLHYKKYSPIDIAEKIEAYYESYEAHKKFVLQ
jgi:hypothetical protein